MTGVVLGGFAVIVGRNDDDGSCEDEAGVALVTGEL
jgi:hypothetical protein